MNSGKFQEIKPLSHSKPPVIGSGGILQFGVVSPQASEQMVPRIAPGVGQRETRLLLLHFMSLAYPETTEKDWSLGDSYSVGRTLTRNFTLSKR